MDFGNVRRRCCDFSAVRDYKFFLTCKKGRNEERKQR